MSTGTLQKHFEKLVKQCNFSFILGTSVAVETGSKCAGSGRVKLMRVWIRIQKAGIENVLNTARVIIISYLSQQSIRCEEYCTVHPMTTAYVEVFTYLFFH
jgi:hypothetical protein